MKKVLSIIGVAVLALGGIVGSIFAIKKWKK